MTVNPFVYMIVVILGSFVMVTIDRIVGIDFKGVGFLLQIIHKTSLMLLGIVYFKLLSL